MEIHIAKVAAVNIGIWLLAWTPYTIICCIGAFGNSDLITPVVSQLGSYFAKMASALNPIVLAYSHPKFRHAFAEKIPFLQVVPCDEEASLDPKNSEER